MRGNFHIRDLCSILHHSTSYGVAGTVGEVSKETGSLCVSTFVGDITAGNPANRPASRKVYDTEG